MMISKSETNLEGNQQCVKCSRASSCIACMYSVNLSLRLARVFWLVLFTDQRVRIGNYSIVIINTIFCSSSNTFSHSSDGVCCSCSAPGSLGCSAAWKNAPLPRWNAPSDQSSCPGSAAKVTDRRRRLPSALRPSSSSSPAMTSATLMWPPVWEILRKLTSFKWGHCDPQGLDSSPFCSVCLRN